jgi:fido (protein-threonine AMPylation protein)
MSHHRRKTDRLDRLVERRRVILEIDPIPGNYDQAHLRAIHRFLFQDWKGRGAEIYAGEFRPESDFTSRVVVHDGSRQSALGVYSRMDRQALEKLDGELRGVSSLKTKKPHEFARGLCDLFCALDYIHPFNDGNGRTLLVFAGMVARAHGYELSTELMLQDERGRDRFAVARNISALDRAVQHIVAERAFTGDNLKKYDQYVSAYNAQGLDRTTAGIAARDKIIREVREKMNHPLLSRLYNDQYKFKNFPQMQTMFAQALGVKTPERAKENLGHVQEKEQDRSR